VKLVILEHIGCSRIRIHDQYADSGPDPGLEVRFTNNRFYNGNNDEHPF
jgi:hypothetical protein